MAPPPSTPAFSAASPSTMERQVVRFSRVKGLSPPSLYHTSDRRTALDSAELGSGGFCSPRLRRLPRWSYLGAPPLRALATNGIALRRATSATIWMHFATERLLYDGLRIRRTVSRTMIDWRSLRLMVSLLNASVMRLPPRDGFMMDCRV